MIFTRQSFLLFTSLPLVLGGSLVSHSPSHCPGISFQQISAWEWVKNADPGWNLGNTLDAIPDEGSWNNPPVIPNIFDDIKRAGFKSIRLPVTWTSKVGNGPKYLIDEKWLNRIEAVVEQITSRGLYTIVNLHHDSWEWMDVTNPNANISAIEAKFAAVWKQIATKLACTSNLVAFEPLNEARGSTEQHAEAMNRLNKIFVNTINDAGGFNWVRMLTLAGLGEDTVKTSTWFKKPEGSWRNPWAIQYHYYSPYDFIFSAWGKTVWGSQADIESMETDIRQMRRNFTEVPLIIGEWGVPVTTEPASKWRYIDTLIRLAAKYKTATMIWDNGEHFDRKARKWRDPTALSVLMTAHRGINNSLPASYDVSINNTSARQYSGAYIFHHQGNTVEDFLLEINLNGNSIKRIHDTKGFELIPIEHYKIEFTGGKESIRFHGKALARYFSSQVAGIVDKMTVEFTSGAPLQIDLVVWDIPTLNEIHDISYASVKGDRAIPVAWKGIPKVAAVRAVNKNGTPIVDDWTQYLGPLQSGYLNYNTHWTYDAENIIIRKDLLTLLQENQREAIFTFDFWPRLPENRIVHTILTYK